MFHTNNNHQAVTWKEFVSITTACFTSYRSAGSGYGKIDQIGMRKGGHTLYMEWSAAEQGAEDAGACVAPSPPPHWQGQLRVFFTPLEIFSRHLALSDARLSQVFTGTRVLRRSCFT